MPPPSFLRQAYTASSMVLEMAVATALGALGGLKADEYLDCAPLFLILLTFAGFGAGMYRLIRVFAPHPEPEENQAEPPEEQRDSTPPDPP